MIPLRVHDTLKSMGASAETRADPLRLRRIRRTVQGLSLAILVLIPITGLFRIDPTQGVFIVLDRQVWFADFFIVIGFWVFVASALVLLYSAVGAVFCGWICPQNTVSEWASNMIRRYLGRKADVADFSGRPMKVAAQKRSAFNYFVLGVAFLAAAMVYALIPLLYFFPPQTILGFIALHPPAELARPLYWIYAVCVLIVLLDIAVLRHLVCRYMCIYRVWQHSFKTRDTLHVQYDQSRAQECENCNYCVNSCFLDIDPRKTEVFDSCINCGECIVACDTLHLRSKKRKGPGLLRFAFGGSSSSLASLLSRSKVALAIASMGALMFALGVLGYEPYHMSVYRAEGNLGTQILDYRINLANKLYAPADFEIHIDGLRQGDYVLEKDKVHFAEAGRKDIALHLRPDLPRGILTFSVRVIGPNGWQQRFDVRHFSPGRA